MFLGLCLKERSRVSNSLFSRPEILYLLVVVVLELVVVLEVVVVLELVVLALLGVVGSEVVAEPELVVDGVVAMLPVVEETVKPSDVLVEEADLLTVQARS